MKYFIILMLLIAASPAKGAMSQGWKFSPSAMFFYGNSQSPTAVSSQTRIVANASLGYVFQSSPLFLGAVYDYDSTSNSGSATSKDLITSYGGSLGILTDNILMIISYLASSQYDSTVGANLTSYSQGSGFQFTLGYMFNFGQSTSVGPHFKYRSISYAQQRSPAGVNSSADLTLNSLLPYLALNYSF